MVGNIPEEMLNRGTESPAAISIEEHSSEEDSEEEEEEVDTPVVDDIEKEQVSPLNLNSTKAEERRSVTRVPLKVNF